jgi:hypothetical protein
MGVRVLTLYIPILIQIYLFTYISFYLFKAIFIYLFWLLGRYKAGRYPLWGSMYLRWWIVEQIVNIMGKGFFKDDFPIIGTKYVYICIY